LPQLASRDWIAGAILWCYQDYKSRRNLWPGQQEGYVEHGLVDEARQRKPSYEVWKQLTSPATIDAHWTGAPGSTLGFAATVTPNPDQDLPSYPLYGYEFGWRLLDEKGRAVAHGQQILGKSDATLSMEGALPFESAGRAFRLVVTLVGPTGSAAAERTLEWPGQH
jgi:beta-glucuronidase